MGSRSATPHLCRQAARGWPHTFGLQHPEGVYIALGAAPPLNSVVRKLSVSGFAIFSIVVNISVTAYRCNLFSPIRIFLLSGIRSVPLTTPRTVYFVWYLVECRRT